MVSLELVIGVHSYGKIVVTGMYCSCQISLNASFAEIKCHLMSPFLKDFQNSLFSSALSMLIFLKM